MVVNPIIIVITITNYPSSFNIPPAAVWIVPSPWVPVRPRGSPRIKIQVEQGPALENTQL